MVTRTALVTGAAALVSAASVAFAGAALASADATSAPDDTTSTAPAPGPRGGDRAGFGRHARTEVTGAEASKVTDAVTKKAPTVTVGRVMKAADGSYHVMGTQDGSPVMIAVSKDLATVEVRTGGPGRGHGGRHGGPGQGMTLTEVTGAERTKVVAAVEKQDAAFTAEDVRKDDQGAYHVMGTKDGDRAMAWVSADLATIDVHTRGDGRGPGAHAHTEVTGATKTSVVEAVKKTDAAVVVESVRQDPDGSYDVMGTKNGARVMVEVSKDLATVEVRTSGPGAWMGGRGRGGAGVENTAPSTTVPSNGTSPADVPTLSTTSA